MAFEIGTNTEYLDFGQRSGNFENVAVKCWFTASSGKIIPLMMKVKTKEEEILTIHDIHVVKSERQWFSGILNIKYHCEALIKGRMIGFVLYFCPEECTWKLETA